MAKNPAPAPAEGTFEDGYERVAEVFAHQLKTEEIGAGLAVYRGGQCVVDLWGGLADRKSNRAWERDTRIVVFSVTKGFAAMALHLLADRGLLDWSEPVGTYWPEFSKSGKSKITVGQLLGHRAGLAFLGTKLSMDDLRDPSRYPKVLEAMETQEPSWRPGEDQGYHAITFGMYARELFERIAGESMGAFLRREIFEPLASDVHLGTPQSEDSFIATLYPPATPSRVFRMMTSATLEPESTEAFVLKEFLDRKSTMRQAFTNPAIPGNDMTLYNKEPVRRSELAWASATGSAQGVARAYLPFSMQGSFEGRQFLKAETLEPAYRRLGWSNHDRVLQKPLGWSNGFLKEERHLFSPNPESFGHAGMGGALGWVDPVNEISFGYVMNKMDWHVRSPRAVALCRALYESTALIEGR